MHSSLRKAFCNRLFQIVSTTHWRVLDLQTGHTHGNGGFHWNTGDARAIHPVDNLRDRRRPDDSGKPAGAASKLSFDWGSPKVSHLGFQGVSRPYRMGSIKIVSPPHAAHSKVRCSKPGLSGVMRVTLSSLPHIGQERRAIENLVWMVW
jgi:hypothetical protein